jgi:hypothetical protein
MEKPKLHVPRILKYALAFILIFSFAVCLFIFLRPNRSPQPSGNDLMTCIDRFMVNMSQKDPASAAQCLAEVNEETIPKLNRMASEYELMFANYDHVTIEQANSENYDRWYEIEGNIFYRQSVTRTYAVRLEKEEDQWKIRSIDIGSASYP